MTRSTKPTYEELEYDHAVLYEAYQVLKKKHQDFVDTTLEKDNRVSKALKALVREVDE